MNKKIRENGNAGFSLVELIVVIAIMAVMVAVLAPSLLQYVERSRAQKDDSAMGEVANAIQLALSDQDIYDEVLYYTCANNVSCYVDSATESDHANQKEQIKAAVAAANGGLAKEEIFTYNDDARQNDETPYSVAGYQRGVTITFIPHKDSNKSSYVLSEAVVNKFVRDTACTTGQATKVLTGGTAADTRAGSGYVNTKPDYANCGTFAQMSTKYTAADAVAGTDEVRSNTYLYNRTRATIGDKVDLTSQTYRNSEYTVFIRMGSTGGNQASAQDAIKVYGQWNGTNLIASADPVTP